MPNTFIEFKDELSKRLRVKDGIPKLPIRKILKEKDSDGLLKAIFAACNSDVEKAYGFCCIVSYTLFHQSGDYWERRKSAQVRVKKAKELLTLLKLDSAGILDLYGTITETHIELKIV